MADVANRVAREWGIGRKGAPGDAVRNTGALILVAPNDRRVRIEVSEGANTFLTAAETGRIQDQYMVPAFRQGDYATGIRQGTRAVAEVFAQNFGFQLTGEGLPPPRAQPRREPSGSGRGLNPIVLIILFFILMSFFGRGGGGGRGGRRRGWRGPIIIPFPMGGGGWGGGGFGGGGWGGGGGGFGGGGGWSGGGGRSGGGGASGSW